MASSSTKTSALSKAIANLLKNATVEEQVALLAAYREKNQEEGQTVTASTLSEVQELGLP